MLRHSRWPAHRAPSVVIRGWSCIFHPLPLDRLYPLRKEQLPLEVWVSDLDGVKLSTLFDDEGKAGQ